MEAIQMILRRADGSLIGPHKRRDEECLPYMPVTLGATNPGSAILQFLQRVEEGKSGTYDFEDFQDIAFIEIRHVIMS